MNNTWLVIAFERMLTASWQAGAMVIVVLVVHALLARRLSPGWRGAMWALVFLRLVLPVLPASQQSGSRSAGTSCTSPAA